jgi:hypothetical protein
MLAGSLLKVSMSASRLILRRKAILPSALKPTMWKTSLPMSMPIEAKGGVVVSLGCFSGAVETIPAGEAAGPSHYWTSSERQMVPDSMNGAYPDRGSHELFAIRLPDAMYPGRKS